MLYLIICFCALVGVGLAVGRLRPQGDYHWGKQLAIAVDQLANTLLRGWPDETFSARCWRLKDRQPWRLLRWLVDGLARLCGDRDHCRVSYESELWGLQQAPEARAKREEI